MNERELLITKEMVGKCDEVAHLLKALAHPQRLQLLCFLISGEKTVSEIQVFCGISQSQISQFLSRMKAEGLLVSKREGAFVYYSISNPKIFSLIKAMHRVFCS